MPKVKFIENPGYISDLYFIYILYFNQNVWSKFINTNKPANDMDYLRSVIANFGNIPEEFLVFFYLKGETNSFMGKHYLFDYEERLIKDVGFKEIRKDLADYEAVAEKMFNFYFPEQQLDGKPGEVEFLKGFSDLVNESDYPPLIKNGLLTFFIDPEKMTQKLVLELTARDINLSKYFEANYKTIIEERDRFDQEAFFEKIRVVGGREYELDTMDTVYISFCLLSKNTISGKLYDKKSLCLLGYDYRDCLEMLENRLTLPDIETFGKMMSDGRRIEILEYLITYGELSTTEIAQKCLQTVNAVFYHLDMMYQADVLHSRNAGRAVIYRVNYKYFEIMRELLRKYTKKGKE